MRIGVRAVGPMLALAGCQGSPPDGQVIARVDGTEITRRELLGEMEAEGLSADAALPGVQAALVRRLVDRALLARAAEQALVDRTPAYQAAVYRSREMLLAQAYADRVAQTLPQPTAAETSAFMAANPQMFGQRRVVVLDRISMPGTVTLPAGAARARTMDAVAGALRAVGLAFGRTQAMEDTRTMDARRAVALRTAVPGVPAVRQANGLLLVEAPVSGWLVPPGGEDAAAVARAAILARRQAAAVEGLLASLRQRAVIRYQPGFGPPDGKGGAR